MSAWRRPAHGRRRGSRRARAPCPERLAAGELELGRVQRDRGAAELVHRGREGDARARGWPREEQPSERPGQQPVLDAVLLRGLQLLREVEHRPELEPLQVVNVAGRGRRGRGPAPERAGPEPPARLAQRGGDAARAGRGARRRPAGRRERARPDGGSDLLVRVAEGQASRTTLRRRPSRAAAVGDRRGEPLECRTRGLRRACQARRARSRTSRRITNSIVLSS